eukprot:TRINITY_DN10132_c0_g1_i1.p1 TRINITY_DN10132_c0_g1~~TRINITY_DN10132_c0_g1_i1.p1  ORF type:complete len:232 (+),score=67.79 TRINITY_DN10132_c0_g1_i1:96-791(+)
MEGYGPLRRQKPRVDPYSRDPQDDRGRRSHQSKPDDYGNVRVMNGGRQRNQTERHQESSGIFGRLKDWFTSKFTFRRPQEDQQQIDQPIPPKDETSEEKLQPASDPFVNLPRIIVSSPGGGAYALKPNSLKPLDHPPQHMTSIDVIHILTHRAPARKDRDLSFYLERLSDVEVPIPQRPKRVTSESKEEEEEEIVQEEEVDASYDLEPSEDNIPMEPESLEKEVILASITC